MRFRIGVDGDLVPTRADLRTAFTKGCFAAHEGRGIHEPNANPYHRRDFKGAWELGWLLIKQGKATIEIDGDTDHA